MLEIVLLAQDPSESQEVLCYVELIGTSRQQRRHKTQLHIMKQTAPKT